MSCCFKRYALILCLGVSLLPALTFAAAPPVLVKSNISQRTLSESRLNAGLQSRVAVQVREFVLKKNRRFRIITAEGRSLFGRKFKAVGKRSSFASSAGQVTSVRYSGQIRRSGQGNGGEFFITLVQRGRGKKALAGSFNFHPLSQNVHQVSGGEMSMESMVSSEMPACGGEVHPSLSSAAGVAGRLSRAASPPAAADGELEIDVAILLTTEMVTAYGGLIAAIAEADNAVASANTAFTNSEVSQQLRLVYAGQTNTAQGATMSADLTRLRVPDDGAFDEAHTLRDTYGADLVTLMWHIYPAPSCGVAYLMSDGFNVPEFEAFGFSVVMASCATGNYSYAHELGHNMGAEHDAANADGQGAYAYSYGFHFTGTDNAHYRTIMAYASGAPGETRVGYFSNPDVEFQGTATGTSNANNALTFNNTAALIADFRSVGGGGGEGVTPTPTASPTATPVATEIPTATPTATPLPIQFKSVKVKTVGNKCKITGALKFSDGSAALAVLTQLQKTTGLVVKASTTGSDGKFTFKATRNKKYRLVAQSLARSVRCK